MPARTTTYDDGSAFIADPSSLVRDPGRDIDWDETGGDETIPAGTVMSQLASGAICPRATQPGAEGAYGILTASADKNDRTGHAAKGLLLGGLFYEEMLPTYSDVAWATIKAELNSNFQFVSYNDDRT